MNSPYLYHPQPSSKRAADAVISHITSNPEWRELFAQGKMLGVLIYSREPFKYLCAYSGVINGLKDPEHYFVPPIYDLQNPDDFYLQKDAEITAINHEIKAIEEQVATSASTERSSKSAKEQNNRISILKQQRKLLSISLQQEIFEHFSFSDSQGRYKNIIQIFSEAKRGLPPGGSGECAAPRLLQYAFTHHLQPIELVEFWYGASPKTIQRVHGQFYPSCIEKCSPILKYMTDDIAAGQAPAAEGPRPVGPLHILYEDEHLLAVEKPAGVLSVPGKVEGESIETRLHELYPNVKGPMLVHRLDQATSGILLAAKNAQVHKLLQQDFETRAIHKEYLAWVEGKLPSKSGIISLPICPNPDDRPRQIVDFLFGKKAETVYISEELGVWNEELKQTPQETNHSTLLKLSPLTGRTHQLRLHCASPFGLGHSIIGDTIYGGRPYKRLLLHAYSLTFTHPVTGETISLKCKPSDWPTAQKNV